MYIEIKGISAVNVGSKMMFLAILQELGGRDSVYKFVVDLREIISAFGFYSKAGAYTKASFEYKGFQLGKVFNIIPGRVRRMFGLITEKEIQVVLDASGFAYSDQWGCIPVRKMADYSEKCRKSGKKIVLMPQAFGPFNPGSSDYIKKIINNSDLVFARDKFSLKTLLDIVNDSEKIKQSPDFTILLKGVKPDYFNPEENDICIIPNQRMMDMTLNGNEYLEIMHKSIKYLCEKGLKPFFLIMGGKEDLILADKINQVMDIHIPVINEKNPFYVKGIIENSAGVFGSRFHGLACALYSGVVAIGIGWSQKYKYLFEDVGYPEGLLSLNIPEDELYRVLDTVADPEKRKVKSKQLVLKAVEIKSKAQEMFSRVRETIGNYQ